MREIKFSPGLVLCLIIAFFGAVFHFGNKSSMNGSLVQKAIQAPVSITPTALASTGANGKSVHVPILMYHHVGPVTDPNVADMFVSSADFESQVVYFQSLGFESVSLQQVYNSLENSYPLPKKPIVFTFDDGYKDVFDNAIPILRKYGYTGSFAIATELLNRPTYGTWDDVITAQRFGMEIISHTENHLDLTNKVYADYDLKREIFDSKTVLEQKLNTTVNFFVYPYGKYNPDVEELIKQAGYKIALTTEYGQYVSGSSLLATPRVRVHGVNGLEKLKTIFSPTKQSVGGRTNL